MIQLMAFTWVSHWQVFTIPFKCLHSSTVMQLEFELGVYSFFVCVLINVNPVYISICQTLVYDNPHGLSEMENGL